MSERAVDGRYGRCMFKFYKKRQIMFPSGCAILRSYQQCIKKATYLAALFYFSCCITRKFHQVASPYLTGDADHLFMRLVAIHLPSLVKCLFASLAQLLIGLFVLRVLCFLDTSPLVVWFAKTFSPSVGCFPLLVFWSFADQRLFIWLSTKCFYFLFFELCLWCQV